MCFRSLNPREVHVQPCYFSDRQYLFQDSDLILPNLLLRLKQFQISRGNQIIQQCETSAHDDGPCGIGKIKLSCLIKVLGDLNATPSLARSLDQKEKILSQQIGSRDAGHEVKRGIGPGTGRHYSTLGDGEPCPSQV